MKDEMLVGSLNNCGRLYGTFCQGTKVCTSQGKCHDIGLDDNKNRNPHTRPYYLCRHEKEINCIPKKMCELRGAFYYCKPYAKI